MSPSHHQSNALTSFPSQGLQKFSSYEQNRVNQTISYAGKSQTAHGFITGIIVGFVVVTLGILAILTIPNLSKQDGPQILVTSTLSPTVDPTAIDPVLPPFNPLLVTVASVNELPPTPLDRLTPKILEYSPSVVAEEQHSEYNDHLSNPDVNSVRLVLDHPVSTFPINVDTASWNILRRTILTGDIPHFDAIRVEEMINYFNYDYPAPEQDAKHPFATAVTTFNAPWNNKRTLVRIGIQGTTPPREQRPPLDLVFLVDVSGSMDSESRLGFLKQSLLLLLPELRSSDRIGIVTYAGSATTVLKLTPASSRNEIIAAIGNIQAGGSTAGAEGLQAAYNLLASSSEFRRSGRVLLATDGGFNVGTTSDKTLESFIEAHRNNGIYLSVLGFNPTDYNNSLMQAMAVAGNGNAAHIDTLSEARKVLVEELTGALWPIADDVKIEVEFNPALVSEYRLLGYEGRGLNREDFNNKKDAGEINAGYQVTALYEITLTNPNAGEISNLRYKPDNQATVTSKSTDHELGFVKLLYKTPGAAQSALLGTPIVKTNAAPDHDTLFAAAIAGFGELMKNSEYIGTWSYVDAATLAVESRGPDPFQIRGEAINLIEMMGGLKETQ